MKIFQIPVIIFLLVISKATSQEQSLFEPLDVFQLEYTGDPRISPDGQQIVYRRTGFDIMEDKSKGNLWILNADGSNHRKLTSYDGSENDAHWSPDGSQIVFTRNTNNGTEIFMYWLSSGTTAKLSQVENSPSNLAWSPNGQRIAFTMKINEEPPIIAKMPKKPKDAKWADTPRITDRLKHEADGQGYIKPGFTQIFTIPSEGGTPKQWTSDNFNNDGNLSWSPDSQKIYFSANRNENWEYEFRNSEVYAVNLITSYVETLTDRSGPDNNPIASADGKWIAYTGFEDRVQAYQVSKLQLMNVDGSGKMVLSKNLDRDVENVVWAKNSKGLYFTYDDKGATKLAYIDLEGNVKDLTSNVGGTTLGRPYASGSFSVSEKGKIAYTISFPDRPADIAVMDDNEKSPKIITQINEDLFAYKKMGQVNEVWYKSSIDGRDIQGWYIIPADFDKHTKHPLIVENHGGPILNYGPRFSAEMQLYAAAGYIVFYPNPRGSTSYGEEFGNLLYNNYPGQDYNDVMDGVEAMIKLKRVDKDKLYVTGGSAGGIMTAWIIGKNDRFKAAVVAKPVMNWISKTLTADNYYGYADSRYPGQPWENFENYWKFSPISLVGNIKTPTMVMVGMNDLRTPPSEAKQLYHALKLRKIETVLVEIPDASHGIANRPSNLITKVAHTLAWFEKYK